MAEEFSVEAIEAGVTLVSVLGKKRALSVLDPERPGWRRYGFMGGVNAIRDRFWDALSSKSEAEANQLMARWDATTLGRAGRAQDFDEIIEEVYAAIVLGSAEAKAAEEQRIAQAIEAGQFNPPAVPRSDDPVSDLDALDGWKAELEAWRAGLTVAVVAKFPQQPWEMYKVAKVETLKRVETWLGEQLHGASDVTSALAVVTKVRYKIADEALRKALGQCPLVWDVVLADDNLVPTWNIGELPAPTEEAMARIPETKILEWAKDSGAKWPGAELLRRYPTMEGQVTVVGKFRILPSGKVEEQISAVPAEKQGKPLSAKPVAEGWFQTGQSHNCFFGAEFYQPYLRLSKAQRGSVNVAQVTKQFNRHEQKGYPRFWFEVHAGGGRGSSFEMPVWRPTQGDGWLAQRLDDIKLFEGWSLTVPENAYWLDVQVGQTAKGNPRLEPSRSGQAAMPAVFVHRTGGSMSHGRHGRDPSPEAAVKGSETGGARILWSAWAHSSGGGLSSHAELLWIPKGGSITLDSGAILTFDGEKVFSSAVVGSDPSRDG